MTSYGECVLKAVNLGSDILKEYRNKRKWRTQ